jgi:PPM family protein phosphatase
VIFKKLFTRPLEFSIEKLSVKGLRNQNEDNCLAIKIDKGVYFLAVADGMGGKSGGYIASKNVLSALEKYLKNDLKKSGEQNSLKDILTKAFLLGQDTIADYIRMHPKYKGMGTTLTAVLIRDRRYAWANIGDSRIYLLSNLQVKLITEDHSYINDYLKNFKKEIPETILSQYKNIITKVIDGGLDRPDIYPQNGDSETLKEGDTFLLCSDGLILDKTKDYSEHFFDFINQKKSLTKIGRDLVDWALFNGSDDNVSIVLGRQGSVKKSENDMQVTIQPDDDPQTVRILPVQEGHSD